MSNTINKETMMERGKFSANGYVFEVRPLYLGEEEDYLSEVTVSPVINNTEDSGHEPTDKELGRWLIALFSNVVNQNKKKKNRIVAFFIRLFHRDYHYYDNYPAVQPLIKWIERKVTHKGKKIRFYDLERKYGLNKTEIQKLIAYFLELSGF